MCHNLANQSIYTFQVLINPSEIIHKNIVFLVHVCDERYLNIDLFAKQFNIYEDDYSKIKIFDERCELNFSKLLTSIVLVRSNLTSRRAVTKEYTGFQLLSLNRINAGWKLTSNLHSVTITALRTALNINSDIIISSDLSDKRIGEKNIIKCDNIKKERREKEGVKMEDKISKNTFTTSQLNDTDDKLRNNNLMMSRIQAGMLIEKNSKGIMKKEDIEEKHNNLEEYQLNEFNDVQSVSSTSGYCNSNNDSIELDDILLSSLHNKCKDLSISTNITTVSNQEVLHKTSCSNMNTYEYNIQTNNDYDTSLSETTKKSIVKNQGVEQLNHSSKGFDKIKNDNDYLFGLQFHNYTLLHDLYRHCPSKIHITDLVELFPELSQYQIMILVDDTFMLPKKEVSYNTRIIYVRKFKSLSHRLRYLKRYCDYDIAMVPNLLEWLQTDINER